MVYEEELSLHESSDSIKIGDNNTELLSQGARLFELHSELFELLIHGQQRRRRRRIEGSEYGGWSLWTTRGE